MTPKYSGRGFTPGGYGNPSYSALAREEVERLLRVWFAWLKDKSRIHIAPHGLHIDAELQIRRWETRPDLVLFRWRNSDSTRPLFDSVRRGFEAANREPVIEMTRKSGKPRALVFSIASDDVSAPLWAMGLVEAALAFSALELGLYDLRTHSDALLKPRGLGNVNLEPINTSWYAGYRLGRFVRVVVKSTDDRE